MKMASKQSIGIDLLHQIFPELDQSELQVLASAARERDYAPGDLLCQEGEIGRHLFIISEGEAEIFVNTDTNQLILVKKVGPGDYFGEMALINDSPRAATVRAVTACKTVEVDRLTFMEAIDQNPAMLRTIIRQISDHLRNNDRIIIRELRKKNKALTVAYANLSSQEKLRTDFIATLSHELRTPLTSAQGFLHLINRGTMPKDAQQNALVTVTKNVETMVHLINNLLVLYEMHLISPEYTDIDLVTLVDEAIREARMMLDDPLRAIEVVRPSEPFAIRGDKNGLLLAIRSLIENAFKFSRVKDLVVINIYQIDDGAVGVDVIDSGIGVPSEAQANIFDPFFRIEGAEADRLFSGLGVGLAIAKFIIEQHNGRISLQSEPGEGSTFTVHLPLSSSTE